MFAEVCVAMMCNKMPAEASILLQTVMRELLMRRRN
jgi:hypothetical protein